MLVAIIWITACLSFLLGALFGLWWASSPHIEVMDDERTTYWADGMLRQDAEKEGF